MSSLIDREPEAVKEILYRAMRLLYLADELETLNERARNTGLINKDYSIRDTANLLHILAEEIDEI